MMIFIQLQIAMDNVQCLFMCCIMRCYNIQLSMPSCLKHKAQAGNDCLILYPDLRGNNKKCCLLSWVVRYGDSHVLALPSHLVFLIADTSQNSSVALAVHETVVL